MSRLTQLLCVTSQADRDPRSRVALRGEAGRGADQTVHWNEFVVDVARLRDRLVAGPTGGWVLLTEDAYAFAVGVLALWHSGRHAISPPNRQSGALRDPQTRAAGVLTDRPDWFPAAATLQPLSRDAGEDIGDEYRIAQKSFAPLDANALAIEFFTSGTTGDEKPVLKQIRHLESEVEELGARFDARVAGATLFTSASHQHLYGMLFGVLWPLCSGHVFHAQHFLHAGELIPRLCAAPKSALASVPTHLKRLAQHAQSPELRGRCVEVFSSGGPLPEETAHRIAALVGEAPIEVFGSTETGGIAWRRQTPPASTDRGHAAEPALWTPFRPVEVSEDPETGTLRVRSPFVSGGVEAESPSRGHGDPSRVARADSFTIGDRVAWPDDTAAVRETPAGAPRFALLGRADRVVKIGERRLDLTRMESALRGSDWIDDVALTTLQREAEELDNDRSEVQERVAAVVVPSERGWERIRSSGRRALGLELRSALADAWDPVLHPRYWRFVSELPENAQGKITRTQLHALFQDAEWGTLQRDRPESLGETRSANAIERIALVPSELSCFPGHFPDRAVVPGVLQLDWALALAEVWLGHPPRVTKIESLKLLMPLEPGARFRIRVERVAPDRLDLKLWFGDEVYAKGRVRIADPKSSEQS